jgi:hypothetical protein
MQSFGAVPLIQTLVRIISRLIPLHKVREHRFNASHLVRAIVFH